MYKWERTAKPPRTELAGRERNCRLLALYMQSKGSPAPADDALLRSARRRVGAPADGARANLAYGRPAAVLDATREVERARGLACSRRRR